MVLIENKNLCKDGDKVFELIEGSFKAFKVHTCKSKTKYNTLKYPENTFWHNTGERCNHLEDLDYDFSELQLAVQFKDTTEEFSFCEKNNIGDSEEDLKKFMLKSPFVLVIR